MDSKEKLTSVLNIQDSFRCAICLIQDDMQATKHAVAVDFKLKLVYDGYSSQPMELTQESLDIACGIGRKCTGIGIVMEVTSQRKRKR
jgi:hypothetical protein